MNHIQKYSRQSFFLLTASVAILVAVLGLLSSQASANPLRTEIHLPGDCAKKGEAQASRANACAIALLNTDAAVKKHADWQTCKGEWPSLSDIVNVKPTEGVQFISVEPGVFLLRIRCAKTEDNELSFLFLYDERGLQPDSSGVPVVKWMLFPDTKGVTPDFYFVDYTPATRTLHLHRKTLANGSKGTYAQYRLDEKTFMPELQVSYSRNVSDYKEAYNYKPGALPQGKSWRVSEEKKPGAFREIPNNGSGWVEINGSTRRSN